MPPKDQKAKGQAKPPPSPVKTAYLVLYNAVSAAAWSVVLFRTAAALAAPASGEGVGYTGVFPAVGEWTKWTQTLAALEVLHSLLGTRRPPFPPVSTSIISQKSNKKQQQQQTKSYEKEEEERANVSPQASSAPP